MKRGDGLTEKEEGLRDRLAGPIIDAIVPQNVHPTHITCARLLFVLACVVMHYNQVVSLVGQVNILVAVALADSVDGVLARVRGKTTPVGAMLDHVTD